MRKTDHLYLHVPFCRSICYYCDFCHRIYDEKIADDWLNALSLQIKEQCKDNYSTIYIGGGTPTALLDDQLDFLLSLIAPYSNKVLEYTVEANPDSLSSEKAAILKSYGVNRVSLGVQTSDEKLLSSLNRHHDFRDVMSAVKILKAAGIDNISCDLMYSLPGQDMSSLERSIDDICSLDVPHISIYSLTVEENTVFGKRHIESLDEDTEADMYDMIRNKLSSLGYRQYEVSNFSKPGFESRHNLGYWDYDDFLGVSCGASSKIGGHRYTATRDIRKYISDPFCLDEDLHLDKKDQMFENIMMSLRKTDGIDIAEFNRRYDCDMRMEYAKAVSNSLIMIEDGRLRCKDLALLNQALLDFLD